ncbi:hypothetical protein [Mycoplasma sp. 4423]
MKKIFTALTLQIIPITAISCNQNSNQEDLNINKENANILKVAEYFNIKNPKQDEQLNWNEFKNQFLQVQNNESKLSELLSNNWMSFLSNLDKFSFKFLKWYLLPQTSEYGHSAYYLHNIGLSKLNEANLAPHTHTRFPRIFGIGYNNFSRAITNVKDGIKEINLFFGHFIIKLIYKNNKVVVSPEFLYLVTKRIQKSTDAVYQKLLYPGKANQYNINQFEKVAYEVGIPATVNLILK